jgi:tetratricopeptide (TPR) repeat protein
MSAIPEAVGELKRTAKTKRNLRRYKEGHKAIDEAIDLLEKALVAAVESDPPAPVEAREELQGELADCHGIKGGLYRREDKLDDALREYGKGLKDYEAPLGKVSYNLSNTIAVTIIKDGSSLSGQLPTIRQGIDLVTRQLDENIDGRRSQWWAYADLGMFYLLENRLEKAKEQYRKFKECGARDEDYKTTMEVLKELQQSLETAASPVASAIDQAHKFLDEKRRGG